MFDNRPNAKRKIRLKSNTKPNAKKYVWFK